MGVLEEYLKAEADQVRADVQDYEKSLQEWLNSLDRLYGQLEEWIQAADREFGVLRMDRITVGLVQEPRLGTYSSKSLQIRLGSRYVIVTPRARYVAAKIRPPAREPARAAGMVEIRSGSIPEYYLFRWKTEDRDEWFIATMADYTRYGDPLPVEPLDRDRFEAAVLTVLQ
jgi:hypothetical protein